MTIEKNIKDIKSKIRKSLENTGRSLSDITIIAVSKNFDVEKIIEAYNCGLRDFGENRVQEFLEKYEKIDKVINWHMIGHLQRNKVKYIYDKVKLIQSVDSIRLAKRIDKYCRENNMSMNILLEVNVAEDDSKFGFKIQELEESIKRISQFKTLNIKGFMTVAPYFDNPEDARPIFKELKNNFDKYSNIEYDNVSMEFLSMGMSNDYHIAIEEGANVVRIGTDIFGERNY
ncbi:MAG: YggS family pyridoxal phosphate-dependent enzyme [Bacillota bacterium]|nr:YggS family pyridoxal phosphate-dependent enzyme [Bacillota bacterium]